MQQPGSPSDPPSGFGDNPDGVERMADSVDRFVVAAIAKLVAWILAVLRIVAAIGLLIVICGIAVWLCMILVIGHVKESSVLFWGSRDHMISTTPAPPLSRDANAAPIPDSCVNGNPSGTSDD